MKQSLFLVTLLKKHTFETRGAKAPCLNFRIRERMFQGAKVPPWERKFQLPHASASPHMVVCTALQRRRFRRFNRFNN